MSKPIITMKQVEAIEEIIMKKGREDLLSMQPSKEWGGSWSVINTLPMDTICRYLYAPHTVEIEKSMDEQLVELYKKPKTAAGFFVEDGTPGDYFRKGMESTLKTLGRQTPGVITWDEITWEE